MAAKPHQYEIGVLRPQPKGFSAFIPHQFPPKGGFVFAPQVLKKNDEASRRIGKLDGITKLLPDAEYFLRMYLRKDAAASSQIEGTMATMVDAIGAEIELTTNVPDDVDDILHYIQALRYGMTRVEKEGFPLSLRFIRELHDKLMRQARSTHYSDPGAFRTSQNWIGGTRPDNARFVPPPVPEMERALRDLEAFIHSDDAIGTVIKSGLIHAQFETIHPFLDGNGRTGRMLIAFFLWQEGYLEKPVLFLSSYFRRHQRLYYEKLRGYHEGDVESWIDFYLDGVIEIADEAIAIVSEITALRERDMVKVQRLGKRAAESASVILPRLYGQPIVNSSVIRQWTGFSRAGAQTVIKRFVELGILSPRDQDRTYGQSYVYKAYVDIFSR